MSEDGIKFILHNKRLDTVVETELSSGWCISGNQVCPMKHKPDWYVG